MTAPAVQGSSLPESECGEDERVQVQSMASHPYKWICFLKIKDVNGKLHVGSGFKIHLPESVNRTAIVTSGHCTYVDGNYATEITVQFPGEEEIEVSRDDLYASPEYIKSGSKDHDYGLILLPGAGTSDDGFGWSAAVPDEDLNNRLVTICGYPTDKKAHGTMWITGGNITSCTPNRISYMGGTMNGQSGSPVYTWYGGYWTVLGVHSDEGCANSAARFTSEMIRRFLQRMDALRKKTLRSVKFPEVYVRCDGEGVTKWGKSGGGTVDCQYKPASLWERFYIYPVGMTPSLALKSNCKVVIESAQFKNVFIRLDGTGMNAPNGLGGGVVNCQFTVGSYEKFICNEEKSGAYWFRSVQFPHCYIRLDGQKFHVHSPNGGGTVNCQWYADHCTPPEDSWELFYMEED